VAEITGEVEISATSGDEEVAAPQSHKKTWYDILIERAKGRESKRHKHIEEHGIDPKTVNKFYPKSGVRMTPLELTEKERTRGGKNSRRRTARTWASRTD
jgi:hypothetical protein